MKKFISCTLSFLLVSLASLSAQHLTRTSACPGLPVVHQADSIKQEMQRQGYIVVKEASMNMESEFEMPVIVPLTESTLYQFVFIGDASSRSYEVRMFDWDEKQVAYEKRLPGDTDGNVISYAYTPKMSEYHMIKPVQVNKDKRFLCGYVMLLKKVKV